MTFVLKMLVTVIPVAYLEQAHHGLTGHKLQKCGADQTCNIHCHRMLVKGHGDQ